LKQGFRWQSNSTFGYLFYVIKRIAGNPNVNEQRERTEYYKDADIAQLLGISIGRLRNKLTAGSLLPPRIQPPGCRHRLWPRAAVHEWLEQFVVTSTSQDAQRVRRKAFRNHTNSSGV